MPFTIKQLKAQFTHSYADLPTHWLRDWLLYVIDRPASFLISDDDYQLSHDEQVHWQSGIDKMQTGTPLAYLTGVQAFWGLDFAVNEHTLIPRPDTEVLVEQVLAWIDKHHLHISQCQSSPKLLDMGTGSGCIAISLAYELNQRHSQPQNKSHTQHLLSQSCPANQYWQVIATDISPQALAIAKQNSLSNLSGLGGLSRLDNLKNRNDPRQASMTFLQSHWFDALPIPQDDADKFMVIVSNPPYIDKADSHLASLTAEPITALVADKQGLADIESIIMGAKNYLQAGGLLAIEHGYQQGEAVRALFDAYGFDNVRTVQDYGGQDRVSLGETAF